MNTIQLSTILEQDRYVGPIFRGVYPIDQLPTIRDGAYVINTAPTTMRVSIGLLF